MEIRIKTLTPLWTGGVDGKCDRIHETGIIGSLRWWMEALVRGMGGEVCDPTEQKCLYDPKKPNKGICKVCEVFGATGWKRRFRLEVQENGISDDSMQNITADRTYKKNNTNKHPTWYFKNATPKNGKFTIQIQKLHRDFDPEIISGLIQFIADWSVLGARPQMGFGVIEVEGDRIDTKPLFDWLTSTAGERTYEQLPSLKNIFLAKIQVKDSNTSTFNLKYDLRQLFRTNKALRHFVMGAVPKDSDKNSNSENKKDQRIAAKVKMSRPYQDKNGKTVMRVWGWIPETADVYNDSLNREKVVHEINEHLQNKYNLKIWREMNSTRDTVTPNQNDAQEFLRSLLELQ